jgi:hypothetical protein
VALRHAGLEIEWGHMSKRYDFYVTFRSIIKKEKGSVDMGYFDNLDNGSLNKYKKKILKMEKRL